jgi:proteic killer suppression protein
VIKSYRDKGLKRFATKGDASKLSVRNVDRITRVLATLYKATASGEMNMPGWGFHPLTGDRAGTFQ